MKIFLSWSGELSHRTALALREWLPNVIQAVQPVVSSKDIERGSRWFEELGLQLSEIEFGILCVSPDNRYAPWLHFEGGALYLSGKNSRVTPFLIGLEKSQLDGPLAQFNATSVDERDIRLLLENINARLGDKQLAQTVLHRAFERWWPDLQIQLQELTNEACMYAKASPEATSLPNQRRSMEHLAELEARIKSAVEHALCLEDLLRKLNQVKQLDNEMSHNENISNISRLLAKTADQVVREVRNAGFISVDTSTFPGFEGKEFQIPFNHFESVGLLLRHIWFEMEGVLPGHSYNKAWVIRDLDSQKDFTEIGSLFARRNLHTHWDERPLEEVGILPGSRLGVFKKHNTF